MARFDIYKLPGTDGYVVDCQADLLRDLKTRFVIPLLPDNLAPRPLPRLTPALLFEGTPFVLATPLAATVFVRDLGEVIGSAEAFEATIIAAIDMLITGY